MPISCSPLSNAPCILSVNDWIAVLVDLFSLNPFWAYVKILYLFNNIVNLSYTTFSSILEKTDETNIAL